MEDVDAVEPKEWARSLRHLDPVFTQLRQAPLAGRLAAAVVFGAFGLFVAMAGAAVLSIRHWIAKVSVVVIVEPLALFMLLMACYCLVPHTTVGRFAHAALRRAWPLFYVVIGAVAALTVFGLVTFVAQAVWAVVSAWLGH